MHGLIRACGVVWFKARIRNQRMNKNLFLKMLSNPLSKAGFIIIVCVFLLAMLAPIIAPYDPNDINVKAILLAPSLQHWMGTDGLGRDVLTRMLFGGRISLLVGLVAALRAITNRVGAGRSAPNELNTSLNAGITKIMITATTTKATTTTEIGYISADLILDLIASVFSM